MNRLFTLITAAIYHLVALTACVSFGVALWVEDIPKATLYAVLMFGFDWWGDIASKRAKA